eukprot:1186615-Prorocentrum_minimum.AAC.3
MSRRYKDINRQPCPSLTAIYHQLMSYCTQSVCAHQPLSLPNWQLPTSSTSAHHILSMSSIGARSVMERHETPVIKPPGLLLRDL